MGLHRLIAERRERDKDEKGLALFGVVIISLFVFTVVLALASTTVVGVTTTANSRSGIEAMAAAEAGRDTLLASLSNDGACSATGSVAETSATPPYSWQVYRYKATGTEIPTSISTSGVTAGCPVSDTTHVLLRVTGTNKKSSKTILATYKWNPAVAAAAGSSFNSAVASGNRLVLSNMKILIPPGASYTADLAIGAGNFKCEGSGNQVAGSVYVLAGDTEDMNGCGTIQKDLLDRGNVTVNKYGRAVDGRICATGSVNNYYQYAWTSPADYPAAGGAQQNQTAAACGLNNVVGWVDYTPPTQAITGWAYVQLGSSPYCNNDGNFGQPNVQRNEGYLAYYLKNLTVPTIVDMQGCNKVNMNNVNGPDLQMKTSVTIVGNSFGFENFNVVSANGGAHQFNIITPDKTNSTPAKPDCGGGQGEYRSLQVTNTAPITGMIYSPCNVSQYVGNWRGQIYMGGIVSNMANSTITYIPQTVPSTNTSGSTVTSAAKASIQLLAQTE